MTEDPLEQRLERLLRHRAEATAPRATPYAAVLARADRVHRRRRRWAVTGAATAVAGLAVVLALTARPGVDRSVEPPVATPGPDSPTAAPTSATETTPEELPLGAAPAIGYVQGGPYVAPDDRRTAVPTRHGISSLTPFRGGVFVDDTRFFEGTVGVVLVTGSEREELAGCQTGAQAVSADGTRAAWVSFACSGSGDTSPTVLHEIVDGRRTDRELDEPVGYLQAAVGYRGDAIVISHGYADGVSTLAPDGAETVVSALGSAAAVDPGNGAIAGQLAPARTGGNQDTAAVVGADGVVRWRARGVFVVSFSPGGDLVLASSADGWRVLDAGDGHLVARLPQRFTATTPVWEDDAHLLAADAESTPGRVLRTDLAGHLERADTADLGYGSDGLPVALATTRW